MQTIKTSTEQETIKFGIDFAKKLQGGDVILLQGDLGAGKTTLVKGMAQGLEIDNEITSPTFTLMNIYEIGSKKLKNKKLVHIDTYRLEDENDLIQIGVQDYLGDNDTICVIEWPEKIKDLLKNKKIISVDIKHLDENKREINIKF
jgi:tRNA threonylcarbamoyladenosine biosynthesis protein TsaE